MPRKFGLATTVLILGAQLFGCTADEITGTHEPNASPQVWLAIAPPEGSVTDYRVHIYWGGWDPDGDVEWYEWCLTTNIDGVFAPEDTTGRDKWTRTTRTDSVFVLSADILADSTALDNAGHGELFEFRRSHTFFVRAVDDQGLGSPKPVYRSFTARTISPDVYVTTPSRTGHNAALMPPVVTFQWFARDVDGEDEEPDSVRWILLNTTKAGGSFQATEDYIRRHPRDDEWSEWHDYHAEGDSGRFWTPDEPMALGSYVFAIQAMDEAGAITPLFDLDRNIRRLYVLDQMNGPLVRLSYRYMRDISTSSADTPAHVMEVPAGLPMGFAFSADASHYGGTVSGYRYGWDVLDVNDPEAWEIDFTPFVGDVARSPTRTFFYGTHTFMLEVQDNNHLKTRITVVANVVPFTMNRPLLIIDDYHAEDAGGFRWTEGLKPSDREHDEFWLEMGSDVAGFGPADIFQMRGSIGSLPVHIATKYRAIVWDALGGEARRTGSMLDEYIKFQHHDWQYNDPDETPLPNLLKMFMELGGKVLIVGTNVMKAGINPWFVSVPQFPLIYRYELTGDFSGQYRDSQVGIQGIGENSFVYHDCCLNVVDAVRTQNPRLQRGAPNACPVTGIRNRDQKLDGLRTCLPVAGAGAFPALELRREVAGSPNRWFHVSRAGLGCDIYNPPYFGELCNHFAETSPPRDCFEPIYGLGCLDTTSAVYGAPVAFWTTRHANTQPPVGEPARSAVWGFEPVYFEPIQVKQALEVILFDEWNLPRR